jgi:hypothetical protein
MKLKIGIISESILLLDVTQSQNILSESINRGNKKGDQSKWGIWRKLIFKSNRLMQLQPIHSSKGCNTFFWESLTT